MSDDKKDQEMVRLVQHVRDGNCPAAKFVTIGAYANGDFVVTALSEVTKAVDANKRVSELETKLANLKTALHEAGLECECDTLRCRHCRLRNKRHEVTCANAPPSLNKLELAQALEALKEKFTK
jgi:hypothetical protein